MSYQKWVLVAVFLFGVGIASGLATPASSAGLLSEELAALEKLSRLLAPFSALTAALIFLKNASVLVLSFVLSPILCLVPVLSLMMNGWMVGFISMTVAQEQSLGLVLAGLLPHGIFELPALVLGEAAALSCGVMAMLALFKRRSDLLVSGLKQNLRYLVIALVLLLPAAVIETFVTPLVLTRYG